MSLQKMSFVMAVFAAALLLGALPGVPATPLASAASPSDNNSPGAGNAERLSPEQTMARRFPQPVRAGDLIGLPVLDYGDSTIGYVDRISKTADGKLQLVVPYRRWFGWASFGWGTRPVAVPIETVAILGRQIAALEMSREEFDAAPTWTANGMTPVAADETLRIAITRR